MEAQKNSTAELTRALDAQKEQDRAAYDALFRNYEVMQCIY